MTRPVDARDTATWNAPATLWMPIDHHGTAGWAFLGKTRKQVIEKIEDKGYRWPALKRAGWKMKRVRLVEARSGALPQEGRTP